LSLLKRLVQISLFLAAFAARAQTPSGDFFVSPKGNDAWSGTRAVPNAARTDGPFASVARAQAALRELLRTKPNRTRTVMLRGGTYYLPLSTSAPGTLAFTASDSGTTAYPVIWRGYPGETPVISGGEPIGKGGLGLAWKHISDSLWRVELPAATQPFESLFYNGERRLRSRIGSATGVGYYLRGGACYSTVTGKAVDQPTCNLGSYLRIAAEVLAKGANANCPAIAKTGRPSVAKCLDRFVYDAKDPISAWVNLNPSDTACPAAPEGSPATRYPAGDIEVTLFNSWTVDVLRVSCVDTTHHMIYFTAKSRGDSDQFESFGPVAGHRYIVENTKEAFDSARNAGQSGLWFLDRSSKPWTLNYLARAGENPNSDSVVIPQTGPVAPMGGSLISAIYLDCVTFSGITFEMDNFVPPPTGFNDDEISGDTLPEAIDCISCKHVTFDGITVRHTSATGVRVTSGSGDIDRVPTDLKIVNSAFYDLGESGIRIGSHPRVGDRWNHVVQYVTVENNIVQGYSRVFAGGAGIAEANGHDISYLHNDITDGYNSGLSVCLAGCGAHDANGYNVLAQYNHIWNVLQGVMSGTGAIYYHIGDRGGTAIADRIANNLIHDVTDSSIIDKGVAGYGNGGYGIFLDNQSAAIDVESNVVFRVSDSALAMGQGPPQGARENRFSNNILASARKSIFKLLSPSADGCDDQSLRVNVFDYDRDAAGEFQVVRGCGYKGGTASAHPGFGKTHTAKDYHAPESPGYISHLLVRGVLMTWRMAILAAALVAIGAAFGDLGGMFEGGLQHPTIQYYTRPAADPVHELDRKIQQGEVRLTFDGPQGYMESLLEALDIPVESQLAVFSKTSLLARRISPIHPRSIFFNDSVAVTWIPGVPLIELAAEDSQQGIIFYALDNKAVGKPAITRHNGDCLNCHDTLASLGVPGMTVRSVSRRSHAFHGTVGRMVYHRQEAAGAASGKCAGHERGRVQASRNDRFREAGIAGRFAGFACVSDSL
jgi:hypothetical protein